MSRDTFPWLSHERPVQVELAPDHEIDPATQVTRTPGIDARCARNRTADKCLWPYCDCKFPIR